MTNLTELVAVQLERPRDVTTQVAEYLNGAYDVDRDAIGAFLTERLPGLEDDDHDLILSPLFTPRLTDQAIFAEFLGDKSFPREDWPSLIQELRDRPTRGQLVTEDGKTHSIVLRDVTLERYVHRLRLEGSIPASLMRSVEAAPEAFQPLLKAVARRAIWESDSRSRILSQYLSASQERGHYRLSDATYLLEIVESYKPADGARLLSMIPPWQERLRYEIDTAFEPRPFFTPQTQGEHGGDRDRRQHDEKRLDEKRGELAILARLREIFEG